MGFLNKDSLPHLVEKLSDGANIKISGNSYGDRVSTVVNKIVTKADEVTRALEQEVVNNAHSFKVGTGNVDVSSDVQDGFGEVGIKGVTYHNLFNDFSIANDIKNYISTNEDRIKWNKSEVTTNNVNIKYHNSLAKPNKTYTLIFYIYKNTLKREISESIYNVAKFNIISYNQGVYSVKNNETGLIKVKLVQPTVIPSDGKPYLEVYGSAVGEFEISHPILLEGDYTNDDNIPNKIEGIAGVGDKSKNLFNYKACTNGFTLGGETGVPTSRDTRFISDFIEVKELTSIFVKIMGSFEVKNLWSYDSNKNPLEKIGSNGFQEGKFTIPKGAKYIRFPVGEKSDKVISEEMIENVNILVSNYDISYEPYYDGHKIEILSSGKNIFDKSTITDNSYIDANGDVISYNGWFSSDFIRVHKGEKYYIYNEKHREPFAGLYSYYYDVNKNKIEHLNLGDVELVGIKEFVSKYDGYIRISGITRHIEKGKFYVNSDKTQILLDEPLMRLPNGVCDEITRDGKLIRRVGKYVFTGNENISPWITTSENTYGVGVKNLLFGIGSYSRIEILSTVLPNTSPSGINGTNDVEGIALWDNNNFIRFKVARTKLDSQDVTGVTNWLKNLHQQGIPLIVYYKLATPVITELPAPYLRMFKDGHLRFNTLVAPETTHVVQLNKSGQIERSVREVQSLDSRVKKLESFYDEMILETSHKLNLLTYDFEYTKESEDI